MVDEYGGFLKLLEILDRMELPYYVGGSVASAQHGIFRSTQDVDFVVSLPREQIGDFLSELGKDFYADEYAIKNAFDHGRAFNVIHIPSAFKFDIFPSGNDEFSQSQIRRRVFKESRFNESEPVEFAISSAEDTILSKLRWFKIGGQSSTTQWHDVWGIVQVQRDHLDYAYLREWAPKLGIADLLERLLRESS
jgi:hypothetical protein